MFCKKNAFLDIIQWHNSEQKGRHSVGYWIGESNLQTVLIVWIFSPGLKKCVKHPHFNKKYMYYLIWNSFSLYILYIIWVWTDMQTATWLVGKAIILVLPNWWFACVLSICIFPGPPYLHLETWLHTLQSIVCLKIYSIVLQVKKKNKLPPLRQKSQEALFYYGTVL